MVGLVLRFVCDFVLFGVEGRTPVEARRVELQAFVNCLTCNIGSGNRTLVLKIVH